MTNKKSNEERTVKGKNRERTIEERNNFQLIDIESDLSRYYSLREVANIAGVCYKTAWKYSKEGNDRLDKCKRYPDQTGLARIVYTQDAIRIMQELRDEGIANRGGSGKQWKWSNEQRDKLIKQRKANRHYERRRETYKRKKEAGIKVKRSVLKRGAELSDKAIERKEKKSKKKNKKITKVTKPLSTNSIADKIRQSRQLLEDD